MSRKITAVGVLLFIFLSLPAYAKHTSQETTSFFTKIKQEKAEFEQKLLAETDSKGAALFEFNRQEKADRITYISSPKESRISPNEFNKIAAKKKTEFHKKLLKLPKNKFEKAVKEDDKKTQAAILDSVAKKRKAFNLSQEQAISEFLRA